MLWRFHQQHKENQRKEVRRDTCMTRIVWNLSCNFSMTSKQEIMSQRKTLKTLTEQITQNSIIVPSFLLLLTAALSLCVSHRWFLLHLFFICAKHQHPLTRWDFFCHLSTGTWLDNLPHPQLFSYSFSFDRFQVDLVVFFFVMSSFSCETLWSKLKVSNFVKKLEKFWDESHQKN